MAQEIVRFTTGSSSSLNGTAKQAGRVYFAVDSNDTTGSIYFDKDGTHRVRMSAPALTQLNINGEEIGTLNLSAGATTGTITVKRNTFVIGSSTTNGQWVGELQYGGITELYDGFAIDYWIDKPGVSSGTTLNLVLSDGSSSGNLPIYYQGTTRLTTHYGVNNVIHLVYRNMTIGSTAYRGWWCQGNYYVNDFYRLRVQAAAVKAESAITAGNLIVGTKNGYKHLNAGTSFDINYPILYAGSAIAAGATSDNTYAFIPFAVTTTQGISLTAQQAVFIKGTLNGSTFTPVSTAPLTQTVPTSEDGYFYINLGLAYNGTSMYLFPEHRIMKFINSAFQEVIYIAQRAYSDSLGQKISTTYVAGGTIETDAANHKATYGNGEGGSPWEFSLPFVRLSGDTMTGDLTFSDANKGVRRVGRSMNWNKGRDGAILASTSINGYSPLWSVKTTAGSWDVGAYNSTGYQEELIFSYVPDTLYNGTNTTPTQIRFQKDGIINGIITKAQKDSLGNLITENYVAYGSISVDGENHKMTYENKAGSSTDVTLPFVKRSGDTMSGNLTVSSQVNATGNNKTISLYASTNRGIYDNSNSEWLIYRAADGNTAYIVNKGKTWTFDNSGNLTTPAGATSTANLIGTATRAINDAYGVALTSYYNASSISGKTLTLTTGAGVDKNLTIDLATWSEGVQLHNTNETTVGSSSSATNDALWINYRSQKGGTTSDGATKLVHYYFGNRKGAITGVQLHAEKFIGNLTGNVTGNITGNADTADKWKTARSFTIKDYSVTNAGTPTNVDGSANVVLYMPSTIEAQQFVALGGKTNDTTTAIRSSGNIVFEQSSTTTREVRFQVGTNDYARLAAGATQANAGWIELATGDDGNEPVYARQYSGVFSSIKRTLTLLDASGNTIFPGNALPEVTNSVSLGSSTYRWKAAYIGTADSYGGNTKFIYWLNGVPTAASGTIGTTSTPVWIDGGTIKPITSYGGNSATADAFSSGATVTLTGDTTGISASSTKSWSVPTTTSKLSYSSGLTTQEQLNSFGTNEIRFKVAKINALEGHAGTLTKNDGMVVCIPWSGSYGHQIYVDDNSYEIHHRYIRPVKVNNVDTPTWTDWVMAPYATVRGVGTSGRPVYIESNGKISAITSLDTAYGGTGNTSFTANRLVYTNTTTKMASAASLYSTGANLAVNKTSITSGYIFEVSGKSYLNGETTVNGNMIFPTANIFDWNDATYRQRLTITDDSSPNTPVFTFAQSTNSGSSYGNLFIIKDNAILEIPQQTGYLYKNYTTASTTPAIVVGSNNLDVNILRVYSSDNTYTDTKAYGFNLRYCGTGGGVDNQLKFFADNQIGDEINALSINQSGKVGILSAANNSYALYVNGNSYFNGDISVSGLINSFKLVSGGTLNANDVRTTNGFWVIPASITNAAASNHGALLNIANVGTPSQFYIPDSSIMYIYKRYYSGGAWSAWSKISAGYADTAGAFSSNATVTLTGDTTGTSAGSTKSWTIATTTNLHQTNWDFTTTQPLSKYTTFDKSNPVGAPTQTWYNGFVSSHSNYLASYIVNAHRSANWYVGYGEWSSSTKTAVAPTWYKLLHSGNYNDYSPTLTGTGASGTWGINISGNAATATAANRLINVDITVKTNSAASQSHISTETFINWLITQGYIPNKVSCTRIMRCSWSYAGNDILQLAYDGKNYEIQLAGCIIEFKGYVDSTYANGNNVYRLIIRTSPTNSFTAASGYIKVPTSSDWEFSCNGSGYSPVWRCTSHTLDYNTGAITRFGYGTSGMTSTSWLACWDGYNLRALNPTNNNIGALTAHRPLGFASDSQSSAGWGNQTGTGVTTWNDSSGGSIEFRKDNPSSGKLSIKVDGRFYGNKGNNPAMLMTDANGYWGMGTPDANATAWIRTTSAGIIPYQSGGVMSGHQGLGTSSWYFADSYITRMYTHQLIVQGTVPSATMNAGEDHPRITFQEGTETQPVHLMYSDWDSYRSPAGLKVVGGTSAAPAWLEVEGNLYIGNSANNVGPHIYLKNNTITKGTNPSGWKYNAIEFQDNAASRTALIENGIDSSGNNWLNIWVTKYVASSTDWNGIRLLKNTSGTLTCYIGGYTEVSGSVASLAECTFISSVAGSPWPYLRFDARAGGSTYVTTNQSTWGQLYFQIPAKRASDSYFYKTRFFFRQYSKNSSSGARIGYYEDYYLPETNDDRTGNAGYNIFTSKNYAAPNNGTANRVAYYSDANTIKSSNIQTDGSYLEAVKYIQIPTTTQSLATSTTMGITYGRVQCYGTLCLNANTDNSGTEYVILTAGKGVSSSINDGFYVGSDRAGLNHGTFYLTGSRYGGPSGNHGMNCQNSDIVGINGMFTVDTADTFSEGLNFYRSASTWDAMAANGGIFYFGSNVAFNGGLGGTAEIRSGHHTPGTTNTYDLGSSSLRWRDVYARAYYGILGQTVSETASDIGGLTWQNHDTGPSDTVNANDGPTSAWWYILRNRHTNTSNNYYTDLAIPFNANSIYYKIIRGGSIANSTTNHGWVKVLDQLNYTDYTVTKTGSGASGTWGISITGNAATTTKVYSTKTYPTTRSYLEYQQDQSTGSGNVNLRHHNALSVSSNMNDTDTGTRWTELWIGNGTASGTVGNSQGWIALYGSGSNYTQIAVNGTGQSNYFYIPNYSGAGYAVTSSATTKGSATKGVYLTTNAQLAEMTYSLSASVNSGTTNRLAYYSADNTIASATSMYATTNTLSINHTAQGSATLYKDLANTSYALDPRFYVNGNSLYNGTLTINPNLRAIEFRPGYQTYNSYIYYGTAGNEALNFVNRQSVTSFIFWTGNSVNGSDRWYLNEAGAARTDNPAVQIKQNCLYINKLLPSGTNAAYQLYVNGNICIGSSGDKGIYYQGTKNTYRMIRFIDNTADTYGNGISIGGGGLTILGSGESADTMISNLGYTGGSEVTVIASDGDIRFFPGNNSYDASAELTMTASRFWAGVNGNTAREAQVGCQSGAGQLYFWSAASTSGARGLWLPAHGTGGAFAIINANTNNYVTILGNDVWGSQVRLVDNWVGFYNARQGGTRYGYIQTNANRMYFAKENGVNGYAFDFNGSLYTEAGVYQKVRVVQGLGSDTAGWKRCCRIYARYNYGNCIVMFTGGWNNGAPTMTTISIQLRNGGANMKVLHTGFTGRIKDVRIVKKDGTTNEYWLDVNLVATSAATADLYATFIGNIIVDTIQDNQPGGTGTAAAEVNVEGLTAKEGIREGTASRVAYYSTAGRINSAANLVTDGNYLSNVTYLTVNAAHQTGYRFKVNGEGYATKFWNAVWNDYAEHRKTVEGVKFGQVVYEDGTGEQHITEHRLMSGCNITSDTFGTSMGKRPDCETPIAVAGRVLAYIYESRDKFKPGDAVCSGPNGTVSKMSRKEIRRYPDAIIGYVSEIPDYEIWYAGSEEEPTEIKVDGRIWIKVN